MDGFSDYLYKYGLHDCMIDDIIIDNGNVVFVFGSGIYMLDPSGKEIRLTKSCKVIVELDETNPQQALNYIDVVKIFRESISEVDCADFVEIVKQFKFSIILNYYSYFNNSILLKGYVNNSKYEITISEIRRIAFDFY